MILFCNKCHCLLQKKYEHTDVIWCPVCKYEIVVYKNEL